MSLPSFKNPELLTRALTHSSYLNEHPEIEPLDNERLEFLGDAILDFIVAGWLYRKYPDFDEGRLTSIRAAFVRAEKLSELANQIGLGEHLRLGKGETASGGRTRQALLADAFEAMVYGRPYRERIEIASAIKEIKKKSGSQFDPKVVEAFLRIIKKINTKIYLKENKH